MSGPAAESGKESGPAAESGKESGPAAESGKESGSPAAAGVNPGPIMALSTAFWDSQVLLTANRVGLFECLADESLTASEISDRLGTNPRATRLLLNACVGLDLLCCEADRYSDAPAAAAFLVQGTPGYLGNAIRYSDNLYATWGNLEAALRSGEQQMPTGDYTGGDAPVTRDFVYGMHDRALGVGRVLVELVDLSGCARLLDVGGGPGTYAALFAGRYPALTGTVLDLPGVVAHTEDILQTMGVAGKISTLAGSYHSTAFPEGCDAVLISGVFHRETAQGCRDLIARAAAVLPAGGQLVVSDVFTDAGGTGPAFATLFGLNMLLTAEDGGVHADADVAGWMADSGFADVAIQPFPPPMPHRVITGIRT